ncbi:FecR family protein [Halofilum ochraceum]|uniref:FecR family protein n=1 Tax=Halofilum ochraceum TaxID=1611323 RepID=UPI0009F65842|nr:FecR family protein [Halofilum ochraceum]
MQVSVSSVMRRLVLVVLICLPSTAVMASGEPVGRVLVAMGGVTAEREGVSSRGLGRRDPIHAGDTIRTSARGRVQIRFKDGAMVDLDPSSTFEVEEYATDDEDGGGSVVMSFLKGAMRTITGAIGGGSGDSYRMNTSVATLGVRGTAYSLRYCDATCVDGGGQAGLYGRVDDGTVVVEGAGGAGTFGTGQFFFVPDTGSPRRIVAPPEGILDGNDEGGDDGRADERIEDVAVRPVVSGDDDGVSTDGERDDLLDPEFEQGENEDLVSRPGESIDAAFSGAFIGSSGFAVYESPAGGDVRRDDEGRIVGAEFGAFGFVDASALEHTGGQTEIVPEGEEDGGFDVAWGSWFPSGPVDDGDVRGFVYAYTDPGNFTTTTELEVLADLDGSLQYTNLDGPPALGSDGSRWDVSALQINVNFSDASIAAAGILLGNQANSDETIDLNAGFFDAVSVGAIAPDTTFTVSDLPSTDEAYSGDLTGRFLGRNAEGALVAFEVRELDGDRRIVGTRVLTPGGALDGDIVDGDPLVN